MAAPVLKRNRPRFGGWRGFSLLGLALFSLSRAAVYVPLGRVHRDVPASIRALTEGSPITVTGWGTLWLIVAVLLALGAHMPRSTWALGAFLAMTSASAAAYGLSWILLFPPDNGEWSSAILYLGLAVATFGLIKVDQRLVEQAGMLAQVRAAQLEDETAHPEGV